MFGALVLFESEFVHVVAISFTALVLTELLMVALTVRTWHWLMVVAELLSLGCYVASLAFLNEYFGKLPWNCFLNNCLFLVFTCFSCCLCCVIFDTDCRQLDSFTAHSSVCGKMELCVVMPRAGPGSPRARSPWSSSCWKC